MLYSIQNFKKCERGKKYKIMNQSCFNIFRVKHIKNNKIGIKKCWEKHFKEYFKNEKTGLLEYNNLDELKKHYERGGLGDMKVKKFFNI